MQVFFLRKKKNNKECFTKIMNILFGTFGPLFSYLAIFKFYSSEALIFGIVVLILISLPLYIFVSKMIKHDTVLEEIHQGSDSVVATIFFLIAKVYVLPDKNPTVKDHIKIIGSAVCSIIFNLLKLIVSKCKFYNKICIYIFI